MLHTGDFMSSDLNLDIVTAGTPSILMQSVQDIHTDLIWNLQTDSVRSSIVGLPRVLL